MTTRQSLEQTVRSKAICMLYLKCKSVSNMSEFPQGNFQFYILSIQARDYIVMVSFVIISL